MSDLFAGLNVSPPKSPRPTPQQGQASEASPSPAAAQVPVPAPSPPQRVVSSASASSATAAPVTDKLLGLLGEAPASPPRTPTSRSSPAAAAAPPPPAVASKTARSPPKQPKRGASKDSDFDDQDILAAFSLDTPRVAPTTKGKATNSKALSTPTTTSGSVINNKQRGVGVVHPDTPIPNSDVALRLFRKFALKTRPMVPASHGGTQKLSILSFIFGKSAELDRKFDAYKDLMNLIVDGDEAYAEKDDTDRIVDSVMGQTGDTMSKARNAIASFCHLLSVWGRSSAHMAEAEKGVSHYKAFCDILALGLDTATSLVTHGCLDGVMIGIGPNNDEYHKAIDILAESVFASDLSQEKNELSSMKFLLSTGCRVTTTDRQAMLRGTHLLQTIRVLYHVYLTTTIDANKTTARASLQQLVTSVFIRMIATSTDGDEEHDEQQEAKSGNGGGEENFPSENHRDAFLVLRSLCKLSMRSLPTGNMHSHIGLQTSGSHATWDASKNEDSKSPSKSSAGGNRNSLVENEQVPTLIYTQAIHPALESKILALDLLLYILQNTEMRGSFLHQCGPQFHYAIRNYLCVSLLKNCTSDDTQVINKSLRVFVPIFRDFRSILKAEIEAFVTNVFFVILDSKNSPIEHKSLVVTLFEEICSDPTTLAEIFLNYDCDLSAVDLFHRIVNTLSKVARSMEMEEDPSSSTISLVAGAGALRMEKMRNDHRELRLAAMRALRQVLASLHASIVEPMVSSDTKEEEKDDAPNEENGFVPASPTPSDPGKKSLVQIYDSKKKRREEESEVILRFNQKPSAGIAYAAKCGHVDGADPVDVARYLLKNKDVLDKTLIGEYLGREPEYQNGFSMKVLHAYVNMMDFENLMFDDAIRFYLSGFRLPGEAQKVRENETILLL